MNSLKDCYHNKAFSHIYIEKDALEHPETKKILSHFPDSVPIEIDFYKDIFCRSHQSFQHQKQSPALILAKKNHGLVYEGAPFCQSFGNEYFYYTSMVMNCIFDCEYCYLQGMYPSANIVVFVNLEDIFREVELLLCKHPVYLCISYDTDLLALENILGFVKKWFSFAYQHPDLKLELRTKSANYSALSKLNPKENIILAWTLSPESMITSYEHHTPSLTARLECIKKAIKQGFRVRLCFDPMLYANDWKEQYQELLNSSLENLPIEEIIDISVGVFRVSKEYLKQMRKQRPNSALLLYPYTIENNAAYYKKEIAEEMTGFVYDRLRKVIREDKIYIWNGMN